MKNPKLQWFSILFFILVFSSQSAFAGLFDDDKQNWRRIFGEVKKINARLVSLEMGKLKALESVQQDLFRQIEDIKSLLPNLQGTVEQSQAEVAGYFKTTNQKLKDANLKLGDVEKQIKLEIIKSVNQKLNQIQGQIANQLNQQKVANDQFQDNLAEKFGDLKGAMAADMDKVAKLNQKNSQELARLNSDTLAKVVAQMNTQKESLDKANEIIKSELIPTIIKQNKDISLKLRTEMSKISDALLAGVAQARKENKENKDALVAGLSGIEAKKQKLQEVLERSVKEREAMRGDIEILSKNVDTTNGNVALIHENIGKLKDGMVLQMNTLSKGQQNLAVQIGAGSQKIDQKVGTVFGNLKIADEKINKLAESLNGLRSQNLASRADMASLQQNMAKAEGDNALNGEKLNKLITSSSEIATHSRELETQNNEMGQSVTQLVIHSGEVNQSLKNVGQALQTIQGGLANVNLVNEKLTTLIGILKTIAAEQGKFAEIITGQGEIKQSQNQIFKSQMELNQVQVKMSQEQVDMSKTQIQMSNNQGVINQAQLDEKQVQEQMTQNQARIYKAQQEIRSAQTQILKAQEEIRNAQMQTLKTQADVKKNLADLSRKANVNISRNDSIRKTLSTLGRKSSSPLPPAKQ